MSKLLLDEHPLLVLPSLAKKIGLNEAIILQQINYWLIDSKKEIDGRKWTYNSIKAWNEQFPWLNEKTIRRCLKRLTSMGILILGNYNSHAYDRTIWYSIDLDKLEDPCGQNVQMSCGQNVRKKLDKMSEPIPEITAKTSTEIYLKKEPSAFAIAPVVELPFKYEGFVKAWTEWLEYRKERKLKTAAITVKKQLDFLSTYAASEAIEIINASIQNGWQGLFAPKQTFQGKKEAPVGHGVLSRQLERLRKADEARVVK